MTDEDFLTGLMLIEVIKLRHCAIQILENVHKNKGNEFSIKVTRGKIAFNMALDCVLFNTIFEHRYTSYQEFNEIHDYFASYFYKSRLK